VEGSFCLPPLKRAMNANLDAFVDLANWNDCVTRPVMGDDFPVGRPVKVMLELLDGHLSRSIAAFGFVDLMEAVLQGRLALSPFSSASSQRLH
jgi:hypothetical protein